MSPLSGHYRTNIDVRLPPFHPCATSDQPKLTRSSSFSLRRCQPQHFKAFLSDMEERGADLSHVKVKKAEAILLGLEKYGAFTKKEKTLKEKIFHPQKVRPSPLPN